MELEKFEIEGCRPLRGNIAVEGAKNSVLPIMAATILSREDRGIWLEQVPEIKDVEIMSGILQEAGVSIHRKGKKLWINPGKVDRSYVENHLTDKMRSSIFLMGPLLGRLGKAVLGYPGGCTIGNRPIDLHLNGLAKMGISIRRKEHYVEATGYPRGAEIYLDYPSVGATENLIMAGVLARGKTVISNAAREPEIVDLQNFLNKMGAQVFGAGTDTVRITGVEGLNAGVYQVIPDRIVAGTYLLAAAITGGEMVVEKVIPSHLEALIAKLAEAGLEVEKGEEWIGVRGRPLNSLNLRTLPYPGFPTDLQPPMMSLLTQAHGSSSIQENVFENRFSYLNQLNRLGANIYFQGNKAAVKGKTPLTGAEVEAMDLRGAAALVIAGLAAEGKTIINNISHLDRGYERLEQQLNPLNAKILRRSESYEKSIPQQL